MPSLSRKLSQEPGEAAGHTEASRLIGLLQTLPSQTMGQWFFPQFPDDPTTTTPRHRFQGQACDLRTPRGAPTVTVCYTPRSKEAQRDAEGSRTEGSAPGEEEVGGGPVMSPREKSDPGSMLLQLRTVEGRKGLE